MKILFYFKINSVFFLTLLYFIKIYAYNKKKRIKKNPVNTHLLFLE